ncbi:isocitrate lyase/PEP mutase family protein [Bacillus sp. B1-b2]|uniref:isocitrate lyase/PEP mutase family protein n=1 Tax=Bacillus sp. B1-b2 TaxID=2653201 RepID=UPI00186A254A|nr:isocitrate lyase/phosphoenolpyruvate mutase family protein [Bacillus sp. B1-b2]
MSGKVSFYEFHQKKQPLVLINVWDDESVRILDENKVAVVATSSYALSDSMGIQDGENISFKELVEIEKNIHNSSLSVDIESGYADNLSTLQKNIESILNRNIAGINIEDKYPNTNQLMDKADFTQRLRLIKQTDQANKLFINARTDIFFYGDIEEKNKDTHLLSEAISLINDYHEAGADGIFIPGLYNKNFIEKISKEVNLPVNIMLTIKLDRIEDYLDLGVSRISYGPSIYLDWQDSHLSKTVYLSKLIRKVKELQNQGKVRLTLE